MAAVTRQYLDYVEVDALEETWDLAPAEYLVMAAMLIEIKSRMLLPRRPGAGGPRKTIRPRGTGAPPASTYEQMKKGRAQQL